MQVWVVGLYGIVPVGVELDRLLTPELLQRRPARLGRDEEVGVRVLSPQHSRHRKRRPYSQDAL